MQSQKRLDIAHLLHQAQECCHLFENVILHNLFLSSCQMEDNPLNQLQELRFRYSRLQQISCLTFYVKY